MSYKSHAVKIFYKAFNPARHRDPRSVQYMRGVFDAIMSQEYIDHVPYDFTPRQPGCLPNQPMPYAIGTPEADAWLSGLDEGFRCWRTHKEDL